MNKIPLSRRELADVATSLESLKRSLRADLAHAKQLPESEIADILRRQSLASCGRAAELARRIRALRVSIDLHRRTLERLRARMHQIRGGARPH